MDLGIPVVPCHSVPSVPPLNTASVWGVPLICLCLNNTSLAELTEVSGLLPTQYIFIRWGRTSVRLAFKHKVRRIISPWREISRIFEERRIICVATSHIRISLLVNIAFPASSEGWIWLCLGSDDDRTFAVSIFLVYRRLVDGLWRWIQPARRILLLVNTFY